MNTNYRCSSIERYIIFSGSFIEIPDYLALDEVIPGAINIPGAERNR
jgi:hypothetical protein